MAAPGYSTTSARTSATSALIGASSAQRREAASAPSASGSSTENEGQATWRLSDKIEAARIVLEAMGAQLADDTLLWTDNESNARCSSGAPALSQSRHQARRWGVVLDAMPRLVAIDDACRAMPAFAAAAPEAVNSAES